jgi:tRNA pseudouridine32 synthase / 2,5-diamino-6-(5-phospho-D-ribitylamino)-pyrimidin-4(3H)-one deaminase
MKIIRKYGTQPKRYLKTDLENLKEYFIKDGKKINNKGFRFVKPYPYIFEKRVKLEWIGKNLIKNISKEYELEEKFCEIFFSKKLIKINGEVANPEDIIKKNDILNYEDKNRIEPAAVSFEKIEVIYEDLDILVINKPSSYPVHEGGSYSKNCIKYILNNEFKQNVTNLHR